jgi:hypothetical protein
MLTEVGPAFLPVGALMGRGAQRERTLGTARLRWQECQAHPPSICRPLSPSVAPEKDSKRPEWEADCVTYTLDGNILNRLYENDLWKMTIERKADLMSFYVRAPDSKNGKLAASQFLRKGS